MESISLADKPKVFSEVHGVTLDGIKDKLRDFPSSFDFEANDFVSQGLVKETISKLQNDDESTTKSDAERIKLNNFLSYLYSLRGNIQEALEYCEKSLEIDPKDLTANVNKCHFFLKNCNVSDASKQLYYIMEIKKEPGFAKRQAEAKADLAYAYSRAGPVYHERAVLTYKQITSDYPEQYDWKFGLGKMLVRQSHVLNTNKKGIFQHEHRMIQEALDLLFEVASCTEKNDNVLCGRAWVQLGICLHRQEFYGSVPARIELPEKFQDLTSQKCFDTALDICSTDHDVLRRSGQHYRYFRDLNKSEKLLRKAKEHQDTCFANHHLALTLIKKVELDQRACYRSQSESATLTSPIEASAATNVSRRLDFGDMYGIDIRKMSLGNCETEMGTEQQPCNIDFPRKFQNDDLNVENTNFPKCDLSYSLSQRGKLQRRTRTGVSYQQQHSYPSTTTPSLPLYAYCSQSREAKQHDNNSSLYRGRYAWRRPTATRRFSRGRDHPSIACQVNSPVKVRVYPDHPVLLEALDLLKRAEQISAGPNIKYDIALLYRKLDEPDEALNILNEMTHAQKIYTSEAKLVGVYEQKGMCNLAEQMEKYMTNAKAMLCIAIELQASFVKEEQEMKKAWHSYPTLKSLLEDTSSYSSMKMLAKAHKMMTEYADAIKVLETLEPQGELSVREYEDLITNYVSVQNFQRAMLLLKYLQCTEQFKKLDRSLVVDVFIRSALHAVKAENTPTAVCRFRDAYKTAEPYRYSDVETTTGMSGVQPLQCLNELHIVHECVLGDCCSFSDKFIQILKQNTNLKITINIEYSLGQPIFSAMCKTMRNSENIVIVAHPKSAEDSDGEAEMWYNQALMASKKSGGNIIVVIPENGSVPDVLDLPSINVVVLPIVKSCEERQEPGLMWMEQKMAILQSFFKALCKLEQDKV